MISSHDTCSLYLILVCRAFKEQAARFKKMNTIFNNHVREYIKMVRKVWTRFPFIIQMSEMEVSMLKRFLDAQERDYGQALKEIRS